MKLYQGVTIYQDDYCKKTFFKTTKEKALEEMKQQQQATTRYYKKDGINFGEYGKLFTTIEEHGGIKEQYIRVFEELDKIKIDN